MTLFFIILSGLQELLPFLILFLLPLKDRLRFSNRINIPFVFVYVAFIFGSSSHLLTIIPVSSSFSILMIPFMALAVLICCLFFKGRKIVNLFTLFIIKSYTDTIYLIVKTTSLFSFLQPAYTQLEGLIIGKSILTLITFPLLYIFVIRLLKPIIDKTEKLNFWKYLWFIPGLFFLYFHLTLYFIYDVFITSAPTSTPLLPSIWIFATFLTYYLILRMLSEAVEAAEIEKKLRMAEAQTEHQKKQYADLLRQMEEARTARHDLRHILLILNSYAEKGDLDAFRSYIRQILQEWK